MGWNVAGDIGLPMLSVEEIDRRIEQAEKTLLLKIEGCKNGHDWVVPSAAMNSYTQLEILALAKLGAMVFARAEGGEAKTRYANAMLLARDEQS